MGLQDEICAGLEALDGVGRLKEAKQEPALERGPDDDGAEDREEGEDVDIDPESGEVVRHVDEGGNAQKAVDEAKAGVADPLEA